MKHRFMKDNRGGASPFKHWITSMPMVDVIDTPAILQLTRCCGRGSRFHLKCYHSVYLNDVDSTVFPSSFELEGVSCAVVGPGCSDHPVRVSGSRLETLVLRGGSPCGYDLFDFADMACKWLYIDSQVYALKNRKFQSNGVLINHALPASVRCALRIVLFFKLNTCF